MKRLFLAILFFFLIAGYGFATCSYSGTGNWNVTSTDNCTNVSTLTLNGNLTVYGNLTLNNATVVMNATDNVSHITLYSGGRLTVNNSNISTGNISVYYNFTTNGTFVLRNSTVGYLYSLNLLSDATLNDSVIYNNANYSLLLSGVNITSYNTSFSVDTFVSWDDVLTVYWPVKFYVLNLYNDPVINGLVNVTNNTNQSVYNGNTSASGVIDWFNVVEYIENVTDKYYQTNYTFNITHNEWNSNQTSSNLTSGLNYTLRVTPARNISHKLIVIESDDWMSYSAWETINTSAKEIMEGLGYDRSSNIWNNDTLESVTDLNLLLDVLQPYGAVFSPGMVTCLPDFDAISANSYTEFVCYNSSNGSLPAYFSDRGNILAAHVQGYRDGVWMPEYHGRTHFNTEFWLEHLRDGDANATDAFDNYIVSANDTSTIYSEYNQGLGGVPQFNYSFQNNMVTEGIGYFVNMFGFYPNKTICPNYRGDNTTVIVLRENGILGTRGRISYYNSTGTRIYINISELGTDYSFAGLTETSASLGYVDWYYHITYRGDNMTALQQQFNNTFAAGDMYVAPSHRINYVSGIAGTYWRDDNLERLETLLSWVNTTHPTAQYLTALEGLFMIKYGYSVQPWYNKTVVRNYLNTDRTMTLNNSDSPTGISSWNLSRVIVRDLTSGQNVSWTEGSVSFTAEAGHVYEVYEGNITGESCASEWDCLSGNCVNGVCRVGSTFCGDNVCDVGELCDTCQYDCGACDDSSTGSVRKNRTVEIVDKTIEDLVAGERVNVDVSNFLKDETIIRSISIVPLESKAQGKLEIREYSSMPISVEHELVDHDVYRYLEIETDIEIKSATLEFEVLNSWLADQGVDEDGVVLLHYTDKWVELDTEFIENDAVNSYFLAETNSFSVFAVGVQSGRELSNFSWIMYLIGIVFFILFVLVKVEVIRI
jgi:PGF-pre-PGF domain-containing protein